jgi:4-amino-4-deoxy-L-arabinose transferase-like glycosyltransferase
MRFLSVAQHVFSLRALFHATILIGITLRVISAGLISVGFDAGYYIVMGASFAQRGEFLVPWGDPNVPGLALSYSHHMSPLWPMVLGSATALFGYSVGLMKAVTLAVSLGVLLVAYWSSRNLYGKSCALATTAVLAVFPELILDVGRVYSENLTMIFFVLTIWAILKSLKDRRYMLLGGLCAGLVFLSRASAGYFFVAAGLAGLAWRYSYMGRAVFRDYSYLGAIAIFLSIVLSWGARNLVRFGFPHWETDAYLTSYTSIALSQPLRYFPLVLATMLLFCIMLLSIGIYFGPELLDSIAAIRGEEESGLWLAIVLVPLIAAFVAAVFALFEVGGQGVFSIDRIRYVMYAFFPLLLISTRRLDLGHPARREPANKSSELRIPKPRLWAMAVSGGGLVFSFAFGTVWLAPLFALGLPAVLITRRSFRIPLLLIALLIVSAEVGTSSTVAAEQLAVDLIVGREPSAVVAFDGPPDLYYNLSVYALDTHLTLTDIANESIAKFVISSNMSARFAGLTPIATFSDRSSQGILQSALLDLLGRSSVVYTSPLRIHERVLSVY